MWYLKETGRFTIVDKTKPGEECRSFACGAIEFLEEATHCYKTKRFWTELNGAFVFLFFSFCVRTSVLTKENQAELASKISINCISSRLTCHLTDWQYTKSLKPLTTFIKIWQFPLMHQEYNRLSLTDKIHNWNSIKIIFTWNNQKWYIHKAYFMIFASSIE